jgi:hypothetical protein
LRHLDLLSRSIDRVAFYSPARGRAIRDVIRDGVDPRSTGTRVSFVPSRHGRDVTDREWEEFDLVCARLVRFRRESLVAGRCADARFAPTRARAMRESPR